MHRTARAGGLALACCAVVVAALSVVSAVLGWRAAENAAHVRQTYVLLRANAAREEVLLRSVSEHPGSGRARRAFFTVAQSETTLLARASRIAPPSQRPLLLAIEDANSAALAAAAGGMSSDRMRSAEFDRALRLLENIEIHSTTAQTDLSVAGARPWPSTALQRLGLADLALVLLVGTIALVRPVIRVLGVRRMDLADGSDEIERLTRAARSDSLTGLANHRAFQDDLAAAVERRNASGTPFSLLACDLDGLKQINDVEGHQAGDAYIRTVAGSIAEEVAGRGTVYRTGGDEFMVILPDCRGWHALTVAHGIQRTSGQRTGKRALSIGITESTRTESRRALLREADLALYEAKRAKLLAVSYHEGLEPRQVDGELLGPSEHQKALAAALAQAVDARDAGSHTHSETVAELCAVLGSHLGISGERLDRLRIAGLLHDVGKLGVADAVLTKPTALARDERTAIEAHTTLGHSVLASAGLNEEAEWVLHHHERLDGRGYPLGLSSEAIPLESRIIAVADAFEAMTSSRPYRTALTPHDALAELARHTGTQFDPRCVHVLNELFGGEDLPDAQPGGSDAVVAVA